MGRLINLTPADRDKLTKIAQAPGGVRAKRARALLALDRGATAERAAEYGGATDSTVSAWAKRYREKGLEHALTPSFKDPPLAAPKLERVELTERERQLCRDMLGREGLPHLAVSKFRVLLLLEEHGGRVVQVSEASGASHVSIRRWARMYRAGGIAGMFERKLPARRATPPRPGGCPEHLHGTSAGYRDYGCRCDRCRARCSRLRAFALELKALQAVDAASADTTTCAGGQEP